MPTRPWALFPALGEKKRGNKKTGEGRGKSSRRAGDRFHEMIQGCGHTCYPHPSGGQPRLLYNRIPSHTKMITVELVLTLTRSEKLPHSESSPDK